MSKLSFPHCGGCNTFRRRRAAAFGCQKSPRPSVLPSPFSEGRMGVQTKPTMCFEISHFRSSLHFPSSPPSLATFQVQVQHLQSIMYKLFKIPLFEYRSLPSLLCTHMQASGLPLPSLSVCDATVPKCPLLPLP